MGGAASLAKAEAALQVCAGGRSGQDIVGGETQCMHAVNHNKLYRGHLTTRATIHDSLFWHTGLPYTASDPWPSLLTRACILSWRYRGCAVTVLRRRRSGTGSLSKRSRTRKQGAIQSLSRHIHDAFATSPHPVHMLQSCTHGQRAQVHTLHPGHASHLVVGSPSMRYTRTLSDCLSAKQSLCFRHRMLHGTTPTTTHALRVCTFVVHALNSPHTCPLFR